MRLDSNQKLAVKTIDGPTMVVSCAGSGKTTVLLERINEIIKQKNEPSRILAVTFSKAAAKEMQDRFYEKYGHKEVKFSTIHSICLGILRSFFSMKMDAVLSNREKQIFIFDSFNKYIRNNKEYMNLDYDEFSSEIDLYLSQQMVLEYLKQKSEEKSKEVYSYIYEDYKKYKNNLNKIDFDDMIISCHRLLINDPVKRNQLMNRYDYYLIDEFQDTNIIQAEIFYMLSSRTNNICVVGDDDQSIYGFRGADNLIFQNFQTTYTSSQIIYLNKNYRSLPFIIKGASQLISKNENRIQKEFLTHRFGKGKILISEEASLFNETNNVKKSIKELRDNGVPLNNIGVLYRVNRLASGLITLLEKEGIPYYTAKLPKDIHSGLVFGDIESYYRLSSGHGTKNDLLRIINRPSRYLKKDKLYNSGLGKKEILNAFINGEKEQYRIKGIIEKIDQLFKDLSNLKQLKPADFLDYLNFQMYYLKALDETSYFLNKEENTWRNEFFILREEAEMYESFEEWFIAIIRDKEKRKIEIADNKEKGVYLSTFHGAKGLQWENVFIIAANERITPHFQAIELESDKNTKGIEEERRLFYVAMTRAKDSLKISYNNDGKFSDSSRFLKEL